MTKEQKLQFLKRKGLKPCSTCPDSVIDELYNKYNMNTNQLKRWQPAPGIAEKYTGAISTLGIDPFRLDSITDDRIDVWYKKFPHRASQFFVPVDGYEPDHPHQDEYDKPEKIDADDFEVVHLQDEDQKEPLEVNATATAIELAEQHGIDLSTIEGSGAGGRITKKDVTNLI